MFARAQCYVFICFALSAIVSARVTHYRRQRGGWGSWGGQPWPNNRPSSSLATVQPTVVGGQPTIVGSSTVPQPTVPGSTVVSQPGVLAGTVVPQPIIPGATIVSQPVVPSNTIVPQPNAPVSLAGSSVGSVLAGATAQPTPLGTTSSGKRGICYNPSSGDLSAFAKLSWGHDWSSSPGQIPTGMEFVPTMWDDSPARVSGIQAGGHANIMGFNEPDQPAPQANMALARTVTSYRTYMTPLATGNTRIGAPSVSNGVGVNPITGQVQGLEFLSQFLSQCSGCKIGFVDIHWYGADFNNFKQHVSDTQAVAGGLPIWIGEFQCNAGDEAAFLTQALPWLDSPASGVERYSYFMVADGILKSGNGVSALGTTYLS